MDGSDTMVTIEDKLKLFTKLVIDKQNSQYEDLIRNIDNDETEALEAYKKELSEKSSNYSDELIEKARIEKKRLVSKVKVEKKKSVLNKKSQIVQEVVQNLKEKAKNFTEEEGYKEFLLKLLEKILNSIPQENAYICYLSEKDCTRYESDIKTFIQKSKGADAKIEIRIQEEEDLGGIILLNSTETFRIDCSLKSMIDENIELVGKYVNRVLNKAGDQRE